MIMFYYVLFQIGPHMSLADLDRVQILQNAGLLYLD